MTGKRNRVEFVSINNFNDSNLQNDYHFLEDVLQQKSRGKRSLQMCGGFDNGKKRGKLQWQGINNRKRELVAPPSFPQPPNPPKPIAMELASSSTFSLSKGLTKLISACRERDINLVTMPQGMSRRKMNTSRYIEKADTVLWR